MSLTDYQKEVARLLAANRNPDSHFAGGALLNRAEAGLRYSDDPDIFRDAAEQVAVAAVADARLLVDSGHSVTWTHQGEAVRRAIVGRGADRLRLDWSYDSAFRFFPVQPDPDFGYLLHLADLATNKVLALAGRGEVRDYLDVLQLDREYLGLGALMWAACGKDPGLTPDLLLQGTNRHSRHQPIDLEREHLARPVDLRELKRQWLDARRHAEDLFERLPEADLGCLYIAPSGEPITPDPDDPAFFEATRHFGTVRGAWPSLAL